MDSATATILSTVVVEAAGIIGLLIKLSSDRKKNAIEQARRDQAITDELKDIRKDQARMEKKLDEHNGYAKRFGEIEKACVRTDTRLESIEKQLKKT